ncbi:hypothetical protein ELI28_14930 [Rhizobium leguminosarum]|nr:hypothetical protein ELI28_14930 [Rhizobium leguminosarum]TAV79339.1 hypothetical protein ELI27_14920 [Rhizobium leguminosarum]
MDDREPLSLASTLRKVRDPIIRIECRQCDRSASFERAEIVKRHGAAITFGRLRRVVAMGCSKLAGPNGDRCGTSFPCLVRRQSASEG